MRGCFGGCLKWILVLAAIVIGGAYFIDRIEDSDSTEEKDGTEKTGLVERITSVAKKVIGELESTINEKYKIKM